MHPINRTRPLLPGQPLWSRVPTRDDDGRALNDFMMLIPGLRGWTDLRRESVYRDLQDLLAQHPEQVVFADLNLKLNLLWVSVRPGKGVCMELAQAVRRRIPQAVLVASHAEAYAGEIARERRRGARLLR